MHDLRLIHTDLKPENILLVSSDYIKVPDYKVLFTKSCFWSLSIFCVCASTRKQTLERAYGLSDSTMLWVLSCV